MTIEQIRLESKQGGRSGHWSRDAANAEIIHREEVD
jgi:hypothetical protein